MSAFTFLALVAIFAIGCALGWSAHAARAASRTAAAEATLLAMREQEHVLRQSVHAAGEDAARRNSAVVSEQVSAIVEPLREALGALGRHVAEVEAHRTDAYAGLREQVAGMQRVSHQLSTQTGQLVSALRAPQVRGRWGEVQLERVVELAGMVEHCDFETQVTKPGARPDLVVRLAGGKQIVVDAKVPLAAFLDAAQETDQPIRDVNLARHARQLRAHVDQLSAKAYWELFEPAPEFVVLFVPGDSFLDAALSADASLLEYAFSRNVILATPTTLVALLRTIAHTWRQEALAADVALIAQLGRELYARLGTAGAHLDRLGRQLGKAVESFNQTVASMESRVFVTARKLKDLGDYETEVPVVEQIETWPRAVGMVDMSRQAGHANDAFRP